MTESEKINKKPEEKIKTDKKESEKKTKAEEIPIDKNVLDTKPPEEIEKVLVKEAREKRSFDVGGWNPKTTLGKKIKSGEITSYDQILDLGAKIFEPEITDSLLPNIETDLLLIGQSKGKFGGGQRRVFKQTQKKTQEGNKPKFATIATVGDRDGFVGIGYGKSKETVPAREKAIRNAKLSVIKIMRGCGSWQCGCKEQHSIPYKVKGKCGSVKIELLPAPKGTGLKVEGECQKILTLAGIKDVWSRTQGQTKSKINLITACFEALRKLISTKVSTKQLEILGAVEGSITVE